MAHIWSLTYLALLFMAQRCHCRTVQLSYSQNKDGNNPLADVMNVTMTTDDNDSFSLSLRKVVHMSSDIPVHTLVRGSDGEYVTRNEMLGTSENTAFYQDLNRDAVIHVTRINGASDTVSPLLQFKGQFRHNGSLYFINRQSRDKRDVTSESSEEHVYIIQEQSETFHAFDSGITRPKIKISSSPIRQESPTLKSILRLQLHLAKRVRRETPPIYYIDLVAFVDYWAYNSFLTNAKSKEEALRSLKEYYTYVITGVDLLYQGITTTGYSIRVNLVKVVVAENAADSNFTEDYRRPGSLYSTVDSPSALVAFRDFVGGPGREVVSPSDHVMLFTGNDLTGNNNGQVAYEISGQAFTGTLCDADGNGDSVSIIEDLGGYRCISTAAHELGHSISAKHDGDNNTCSIDDRYIMASSISAESEPRTVLNPWKFSTCSLTYFTNFIGELLNTAHGRNCLTQKLTADQSLPNVGEGLIGLKYTANEQCRMFVNNTKSFLCPSLTDPNLFDNPSKICTQMYCNVTATRVCTLFSALRGTVCGNGKLCISGECVSHASAPQRDESCVFGDDPLFTVNNMSCAEAVRSIPFICYNYSKQCCESCKVAYKWPGCEYGDRAGNCVPDVCRPNGNLTNLQMCCGTCRYGSSTTTSSTTSTPTTATKPTTTIPSTTSSTTTTTTTTKQTLPSSTSTTTSTTTTKLTTAAPTSTTTPTTTTKLTTRATPTTTSTPTSKPTTTTTTTPVPTAAPTSTPKPAITTKPTTIPITTTTTTKPTTTTTTTSTTPTTTKAQTLLKSSTVTPIATSNPTPIVSSTDVVHDQLSAPMTTLQKLFVGIPVGIGSLAIILLAGYLIYYYNFSKGGHLLKSRNSFESNRNAPVKHRANNFRFVSRTNSTEVMLQWKDLTDTRT